MAVQQRAYIRSDIEPAQGAVPGSRPCLPLHFRDLSSQWLGARRVPIPPIALGLSGVRRPDNGPAGYSHPQSRSHNAKRCQVTAWNRGQAVMGGSDGLLAKNYAGGITHGAATLKRASSLNPAPDSLTQGTKRAANGAPQGTPRRSIRRPVRGANQYAGGWRLAPDTGHHAGNRVRQIVFSLGERLAYPHVDGVAHTSTGLTPRRPTP
jgi:hypothetical protein